MKTRYQQGSYTVEMVFLFPIIIFVIVGLVYLTFYLHDQSVLRSYVDRILFRSSNTLRHISESETGRGYYNDINSRSIFFPMGEDIGEILSKEAELVDLHSKFFLKERVHMEIVLKYGKITATTDGSAEIPGIAFGEYFRDALSSYQRQRTGEVYNPAEFVWKISAAIEMAEGIKGVEKQVKKLQDFIQSVR